MFIVYNDLNALVSEVILQIIKSCNILNIIGRVDTQLKNCI